jgi:hypothetical protein
MSTKAKETNEARAQVPELERCLFTSSHGRRCSNPHKGNATGYCVIHEGRVPRYREQKVDEAEVKAVAEQLLANNVELRTKDDVNRFTWQLLTMVSEKRISRQDGSLLAYIASVLLQTIAPVRKKPVRDERIEFPESPAEPIPDERVEFNRKVAARFTPEPPMPGRTYNPYEYPSITHKR